MNQDYFADPEEVSQYLNASSALFGDEEGNVLPLDTGAVMHRQVSNQEASTPFIDWFVQNVVSALEQPGTLKKEDRVFFVSGRAGARKINCIEETLPSNSRAMGGGAKRAAQLLCRDGY